MVEKEPVGHEVARVQDDGRQHVEEEGGRRQRRYAHAVALEQQQADDDADHNQQTRLGEDGRQLRRHVESCTFKHKQTNTQNSYFIQSFSI